MNIILKRQKFLVVCAIIAIRTCVPGARAQETRGSIQGTILDGSEAVVPRVVVAATNTGTNVTLKATTNQEGLYNLMFLLPGVYSISVSAPGFKTSRRDNIQLPIHERLQIDFSLELGAVNEQVQITAEAPLLQTATANLGVVIDSRRIAELPVAQGSPFSLMYLSPGVVYALAGASPQQSPQAITADSDFLSINGAPTATSDFTIDGIPNTQTSNTGNGFTYDGSAASASPPADIVDEFKVENAFDASVGHNSGTVMNISLKTGTNTPHGTAYVFDREPGWNANTFFANRAGQPLGQFTYKRWGTSLSGPVFIPKVYNGRNRTFFIYGYEGGARKQRGPLYRDRAQCCEFRRRFLEPAGPRRAIPNLRSDHDSSRRERQILQTTVCRQHHSGQQNQPHCQEPSGVVPEDYRPRVSRRRKRLHPAKAVA